MERYVALVPLSETFFTFADIQPVTAVFEREDGWCAGLAGAE